MGYLGRRPETLAGVTDLASNVAVSVVNANVGILANLQTTEKSNVVAAINEVRGGGFSNVLITGGSITNTSFSGTITTASIGTLSGGGTYANVFTGDVSAASTQLVQGNVILQGAGNGITFTKGTTTYAKYLNTASGMANLNYLEGDTWYINNLVSDTIFNFNNVPTGGVSNTVISSATIIYPTTGTAYRANIWVNGSPAFQNNFLYGTIPTPRTSAVNVYTFTIVSVNQQVRILGSHAYYDTF